MSVASLYTAVSALKAHQVFMGTIANDLANVNTVGYKASRTSFADSISQMLKAPSATQAVASQLGLGAQVTGNVNLFTQGAAQNTGVPKDFAIQGDGFFVVKNAGGNIFYTRAGNFVQNDQQELCTPSGEVLQGITNALYGGAAAAIPPAVAGDVLGSVKIPMQDPSVPPGPGVPYVTGFSVDNAGEITLMLDNGTNIAHYAQISLQKFTSNESLEKAGNNLYSATQAAGQIDPTTGLPVAVAGTTPTFQIPGEGGTGAINQGFLELSNVDLSQEFSDMIRAQRGLQANARVVTTSDEIIQELVNLKR